MRGVKFALVMGAALACASPAFAQYGMDRNRPKGTPELPHCARPIGTVAIQDAQRDWWSPLGLGNPESVIKLMASRSGCLRVVARGAALQMRQQERELADSGEMRRGSNIGRGQVVGADYTIIPDIADSNGNAGGMNLGGIGRAFGGRFGGVLGGINTSRAEAHVLLSLINTRTTEQEYTAEGTAQKTNFSWDAGGWGTTFGAVGGGYSNTDIGKVIIAAYLNAFVDLINHMQGMAPDQASAQAGIQAYGVIQPTALRRTPSPQGATLRSFNSGDLVYPTGQKNGIWWEVDDENGNRGWVTSTTISPRAGGH